MFFDPTAYTFTQGTLYLSGLSFGFGVTDRLQITTKWGNFFWGNINIRPKFQIFESGGWESQTAFAVGAHYHTRWMVDKFEWKDGKVDVDGTDKYWGGFYRIGSNPTVQDDIDGIWIDEGNEDEPYEMTELFGALTYSHARKGIQGRISHTIGGNFQHISELDKTLYRVYYGLDADITSKIKMIAEIFYDPFYLELWQEFENDIDYYTSEEDSFSDEPVGKGDV